MTDTIETLSVGQQIKTAREALNLSIIDVAQKTNLKKAHLEAIEDDIFILPNVPPTFVRGYVRNYVRFLRLPEALVNTVNYGEVTIPKEVRRSAAPIPVKNNQKSQARWVKGLTWLILLGAIGMTLAWWWQDHKKEQAKNAQLISNAIEIKPTENTLENSVALSISQDTNTSEVINSEAVVQSSTSNPVVTDTVINASEKNSLPLSRDIQIPSVAENRLEINSSEIPQEPKVESQITVSPEPVNVLQQAIIDEPKAVESQLVETTQIVGNDELRIEITNAASWITVRGMKNKKLAEKLYNSGDILTFNGNEQYRLTVGAPANVKIYYKGQQVPLKVDGRVARFKLPLVN